jgi:hypothetical protein
MIVAVRVSHGSFGRKVGGMTDTPDLVVLLYRADWTRLSLAAEVSHTIDHDLDALRPGTGAPGAAAASLWGPPHGPRGPPTCRGPRRAGPRC